MAINGGKPDAQGYALRSVRICTDADANAGLGDALDPLRVDPTGTTVQPVSFSSPQHVIVDSGAGGGTQYAEGTTQATATGTVALGKNSSNVVSALPLTANGLKTDGSAVTQPVSIAAAVTVQQSTAANLKVDLSGTAANATAIKVDGSAVTQPVSIAALKEDSAGNLLVSQEGRKATYTTALNISLITGVNVVISCTGAKKVKLISLVVGLSTTGTPAIAHFLLRIENPAPTSGTSSAGTVFKNDSTDVASTVSVKSYTVAPTDGTTIGLPHSEAILPASASVAENNRFVFNPLSLGIKPPVLNSSSEVFVLTVDTAPASTTASIQATWTEE